MFGKVLQGIQQRFSPNKGKIVKPIPERDFQDNNNKALDWYYQQNRAKEDFYKQQQQQQKPQPTQVPRKVTQPMPKPIQRPQVAVKGAVTYASPSASVNYQQALKSGGLASNSGSKTSPTPTRVPTPTPSPYPTITPPPDQAAAPYAAIINRVSKQNNIPDHILYNMLKKESNFNPNAGSHAGAQGIAQVVPKWHPNLKDPYNPEEAIPYAGKHLRNSFDAFGSWENALAAYNAGGPAVGQYGGIPPFPETQDYVAKIMEWVKQDRKRYKTK